MCAISYIPRKRRSVGGYKEAGALQMSVDVSVGHWMKIESQSAYPAMKDSITSN